MSTWRLRTSDGRLVAETLEIAATWWARFAGLQLRRPLPPGHALLIVPCPSIHTCFVRSSLDVWFLDRTGKVVDERTSVRPWRIAIPRAPAYAVLEATPGWLTLAVGEVVAVESPAGQPPPHVARFHKIAT